ncbi:MAG: hypothetical protein KJO49_05780 [Bacteroidia bacterium]|nr:hypothetical protein [Bacteroidia bacterium]MBT8267702.1 hypothetical protein [Bacteroidia bacterium]NNF81609.1 hypothetical protein [Flavobacteriaceae bacterium]NNK71230.1 hypothetical protein [Flavobacteriaceae bacterium]NNL78950.1 hypothetical protein [Flavobacteriaceae bacterium]
MKRIDQKVKEIEKKDKQNRLLYIGFVVLILAFMAAILYYQDQIAKKDQAITDEQVKNSKLYQNLEEQKNTIEDQKNKLEASLKPEEYWEFIKKENSVESYIQYLTNVWGIERDSTDIKTAKTNLKSNGTMGEGGWIYIGTEDRNGFSPTDSQGRQIAEIFWRDGVENVDPISKSKPEPNDILKLVQSRNRTTYTAARFSSSDNKEGWRPSTKAFVTKVEQEPGKTNIWAYIRYY